MCSRVLLIAEACNPEWESVPLVGYNWFRALADVADVTLVTHVRNRGALLGALDAEAARSVHFVDSERIARPFYLAGQTLTFHSNRGWTTRQALMALPYLYFEHLVFRRFRRALETGRFDLIHRVTPLSPTYASPLASWSNLPFVLGPLNGGLPWPRGTAKRRLAELEVLSSVRRAHRLLPYHRRTYARAACILAGSSYTLAQLPRAARRRAAYLPENGIDPRRFHATGRMPPSRIQPLRILFVGRLVPYKGADLLIEAFAGSALLRGQAELQIVGDGPQRCALERLASGANAHICFAGRIPPERIAECFRAASIFAFPSLREFGGAVVMEAMACGLPCVVANYGGPGDLISPETGIGIPIARRNEMVADLRATLEALCAAPQRLDAMSQRCALAAQEHAWPRKAAHVRALYDSILAR